MKEEISQKRKREVTTDESTAKDESALPEPEAKKVPAYGTKDYWEHRYHTNQSEEPNSHQEDAPEAFHSWYFNYEELSPILLPIILGDDENNVDNDSVPEDGKKEEGSAHSEVDTNVGKEDPETTSDPIDVEDAENIKGNGNKADSEVDNEDEDEHDHEEFEDDSSTDQVPSRVGLSKDGAISVLEIGCGDVPLGRDLARGIEKLEASTGVPASNILKKVVCTDYAKSVIDCMKTMHEKELSSSVSVLFEVGDARKLAFPDSSFELILEKGTMDAMLSDTSEGTENCKQIVAESARLLTAGGCLLIVSHLNAHVKSGLEWLDMIVIPGLRKGAADSSWVIEVHGSAPDNSSLDGGNAEESNSPGPAVYVIYKGKTDPNDVSSTTNLAEDGFQEIPLRFFSY
eukprot:scaffold22581_cov123-Cylindrotheca_fusiformis.AAC.14